MTVIGTQRDEAAPSEEISRVENWTDVGTCRPMRVEASQRKGNRFKICRYADRELKQDCFTYFSC